MAVLHGHALPHALSQPAGLPVLLGLGATLVHGREPRNLDQFAAGEDRGSHEEAEGAANVAEEVDGAVAELLLDEFVLEVLGRERELLIIV